ncbi:uncharacterized protein LOC127877957 [Dreissena polymorpha]|uniref:Deltamethrin resistance protein prag01 domain-containing protein n=1 Tax=Dreissena polymorpha TaxID=45954 RepID=A0A9D4KII3_DREPO|nr:uncharacterized protein LOC127877957 [Dreissena polymorpha]KAH3840605.1 hypothetical protein DPMN_114057 [Dreissena polymorpha]
MTLVRTVIRPWNSLMKQSVRFGSSVTPHNSPFQQELQDWHKENYPEEYMTPREKALYYGATLDHLPVVSGPFAKVYAEKQRNYHMHLFLGATILIASIVLTNMSGILSGPNLSKPLNIDELYNPRNDMRDTHRYQIILELDEDEE